MTGHLRPQEGADVGVQDRQGGRSGQGGGGQGGRGRQGGRGGGYGMRVNSELLIM